MVTKPAMTTTNIARRMSFGMTLRIAEMTTLQQVRMMSTDRPMPMPLKNMVVMAIVEHRPMRCTSTGLLVMRPSVNCFFRFMSQSPP